MTYDPDLEEERDDLDGNDVADVARVLQVRRRDAHDAARLDPTPPPQNQIDGRHVVRVVPEVMGGRPPRTRHTHAH